ncbi:hypothetical protein LTLLF_174575 [Microtus ochrogaster]|uniref:Uncharacterized protein n=1 Tax=Microtus ochrogaster TaxID=79684 RepID=A0A8J6KQ75_MICOH|nr:hypothetical protein LTLLF_174575 [Microtus ochrogaster]
MPKSQDYVLTGHWDTQGQAPNYSTEQVSYDQVAPLSLTANSVEPQEATEQQLNNCGEQPTTTAAPELLRDILCRLAHHARES